MASTCTFQIALLLIVSAAVSMGQNIPIFPVELVNSAEVSSPPLFIDESLSTEADTVRRITNLEFGVQNRNAITFNADVVRPSAAVESVEGLVFDSNTGQLSFRDDYGAYTNPLDNQLANDWSLYIGSNQSSFGLLSSQSLDLELEFPILNATSPIDKVYYWSSSNHSKVYFANFGRYDISLTILDMASKALYSSIISVPGFNVSRGYEQQDPYNIARAQRIEISPEEYLIGFGGVDLIGGISGVDYNVFSVNESTLDPAQVLTLKQRANLPGFWPVIYSSYTEKLATISGIFYEPTTEATLSTLNVHVLDLSNGAMTSQKFLATEPWRLYERYLTIAITVPICIIGGCFALFAVLVAKRRSFKKNSCNKCRNTTNT